MNAPAHQPLHQLLHLPQGCHPGAVDGLLAVDNIRAGIECAGAALPYESDLAPLPGGADGQLSARVIGGGIDGPLNAPAACDGQNLLQRILPGLEHIVRQSQLLRQFNAVFVHLYPDEPVGPHGPGQHQRRQTHRPQARHQDAIVAADADLLDGLIDRAESAGHLGPVLVGQLVRQFDEVFLLRQDIGRHAAVSLPAVCLAELALAGDIIASPAVVTDAAARDMIYDHPVAFLEAL